MITVFPTDRFVSDISCARAKFSGVNPWIVVVRVLARVPSSRRSAMELRICLCWSMSGVWNAAQVNIHSQCQETLLCISGVMSRPGAPSIATTALKGLAMRS